MTPKFIGIDKHYSTAGVNLFNKSSFSFFVSFFFKVTILGIHSPKYEHEKHKTNTRHAIEEQSLPFYVVNDNSLQVWKHVGCQILPTVLIFGPDALPLFIFEGENHVQHTETFLLRVIKHYKSSVRASSGIKSSPEDISAASKSSKFTYPSHVRVTSNGQLCISFAGSNQLILCEIDGKVLVRF